MEMREIEAFLAVAEELHFGRAADRLGLSTSRVSHLVRTLERRVRSPLFERTSRTVRLTPAGEHLFAELRPAYTRIERAVEELRASAGSGGEVLRAGFATTLPHDMPAALVTAFEGRYPECKVVQSGHPTTDLFRWMGRDWGVDLFVTWMPVDAGGVAGLDLGVGPVVSRVPRAVALARTHPLASREVVDVEELAEYEVISPGLPAWYGDLWVPPVTPGGREMRLRRLTANYVEDVLRLVAQGELAHLTFASLFDAYQHPGVLVSPVSGLPPMPVRPVWPRHVRNPMVPVFAEVAAGHGAAAGWV